MHNSAQGFILRGSDTYAAPFAQVDLSDSRSDSFSSTMSAHGLAGLTEVELRALTGNCTFGEPFDPTPVRELFDATLHLLARHVRLLHKMERTCVVLHSYLHHSPLASLY